MSFDGWREVRLGDIARYSKERISTSQLSFDAYVSTENLLPNKGGKCIANSLPNSNAISFSKGQTLLSNIRPYFKKIWFADIDGGCSPDVLAFQLTHEVYDKYFFYILNQDHFFDYVMAGTKGTKMPRGDKQHILQYQFNLPPINEQKAIAATLSCLDEKIELNNRINKTLEEMAQAIFKSWFVDFEPFQDGEFVDSELGPIPKGWKTGMLNDIATITMGQSPKGSSYNQVGDGEVFYQGRTEFGIRFPSRRLFTSEPKRMASAGDILLSVRAPVGDYNVAIEPCCIGRGLAAIQSKKEHFSFMLYNMQFLKKRLDVFNGEGTVFGSINKFALNTIPVIIPPDEVLSTFEATVGPLDEIIKYNYFETCNLQKTRDALLPKLMSGEVRVPFKEAN